jgi:hypothetical protein
MATKNNVAGGNDELSAQQEAQLAGAAEDAKAAEDQAATDKKVEEAHNDGTVADEALAQGALLGADGKTAVSFYNPAPKAVVNRDRDGERSDENRPAEEDRK